MNDSDERFELEPGKKTKRPMSTTVKVLLILGGVGFVTLLICCGAGAYFVRNGIKVSENPEEIAAVRESIADINIPEAFTPSTSVTMNLGFTRMDMVAYTRGEHREEHDALVLMQMKFPGNLSKEDMKRQFENQGQSQRPTQDIEIESRETRQLTIEGESYDFEFVTGKSKKTGETVHVITGIFPGRNGMAFFILTENEKDWNEEQAVQMIESIRTH